MCTREGRNPSINLERYQEALKHPETRLTMSVLRGDRKQSVRDAELMFNPNFLKCMASFKRLHGGVRIRGSCFGMANDERGLSERNVQASINASCDTFWMI